MKSEVKVDLRYKSYEYDKDSDPGVLTFDPYTGTLHVGKVSFPKKEYDLISSEETLIFTHPDHTYSIKTFIVQKLSPAMRDCVVLTFDGFYNGSSSSPDDSVKYCTGFNKNDTKIPGYFSYDNGQTFIESLNANEGAIFVNSEQAVNSSMRGKTNYDTYKVFLKDIPKDAILNGIKSSGATSYFKTADMVSIMFPESFADTENELSYLCASCFYECTKLNHIVLPNDIDRLENSCFYGCSALKYINLPDILTIIGESCFSGCTKLEVIAFPSTVTNIYASAFSGCSALHTLVFLGTTPPSIGNNAFNNIANEGYIYVPSGYKSTYETAILQYLPNSGAGWEVIENESTEQQK